MILYKVDVLTNWLLIHKMFKQWYMKYELQPLSQTSRRIRHEKLDWVKAFVVTYSNFSSLGKVESGFIGMLCSESYVKFRFV